MARKRSVRAAARAFAKRTAGMSRSTLIPSLLVCAGALLAAPAPAQTVNGLVAAYGFEEGSGTAIGDASGRNNNGVASGTTVHFFVNGVQVSSQAQTEALGTTTGTLQIGGDSYPNEFFAGLIDEVRVYNRALSAAEIQADMGVAVGTPPPPVVDTVAPSAPPTLSATAASATQINLSWTAATDNVGVTGYRVERCLGDACTAFTQIFTLSGTTFNNTGLTASTSY